MAARPRPAPPLPPLPEALVGFGPGLRDSEPLAPPLGRGGRKFRRLAPPPGESHGFAGAEGERTGPGRKLPLPAAWARRAWGGGLREGVVILLCLCCPGSPGVPVGRCWPVAVSPGPPPWALPWNLEVRRSHAANELPLVCVSHPVWVVYFYFVSRLFRMLGQRITPTAPPGAIFKDLIKQTSVNKPIAQNRNTKDYMKTKC